MCLHALLHPLVVVFALISVILNDPRARGAVWRLFSLALSSKNFRSIFERLNDGVSKGASL